MELALATELAWGLEWQLEMGWCQGLEMGWG
ncbi:hypothetical protein KR100_07875 [Synechococcus sp. KORDI-100]|nr:hypothetical protein KR100_07875 [Synechococcus sp. KORDI-100]